MNYKETINFLFSMLPVYQNQGKTAIKKDLTNIIKLCEALDNPQNEFKTIHVGGTNGKGTVSHMIASCLQETGQKVGLYTSPHYVDFRERIKINGKYISENEVITFVEKTSTLIQTIRPSFFEMTVAMAFDHFKKEEVDIAVIEVGLGGRLDSTNIVLPELSVITNIGLDHMNILGNSISEIAFEKAGIIKNNVPVVIGEFDKTSAEVFIKKSTEKNAEIVFASEEWSVELENDNATFSHKQFGALALELKNRGPFLIKNIITSLAAVSNKKLNISALHIKNGINNYKSNASYQGRWQWINDEKDILIDSGHNEHALSSSLSFIEKLGHPKVHFVLGFVIDKDVKKIIELLPKSAKYYFCKPSIFRGAPVSYYQAFLETKQLDFERYLSLSSALAAAKRTRNKGELIFVGGSSFMVGELLALIQESSE